MRKLAPLFLLLMLAACQAQRHPERITRQPNLPRLSKTGRSFDAYLIHPPRPAPRR